LLDRALLRRYDQVLEFDAPTAVQIRKLITGHIVPLKIAKANWKKILLEAEGLSQSEIVRASDDAVKTAILDERRILSTDDLLERLHERHSMRNAFMETKGA
jgi:ATP-dependent 26S proteasome regulatory subunit